MLLHPNNQPKDQVMALVSFTLSEEGVGAFNDALICVNKFSDDVCLEVRKDKVCLHNLVLHVRRNYSS